MVIRTGPGRFVAVRRTLTALWLGTAALAGGPILAADGSACTSIADPTARLACYDAALMPRGAAAAKTLPAAVAPAAPKPAPVAPALPAAVSPAVKAAPAADAAFGLQAKPDKKKADKLSLHATVVSIQMRATGQVITLDNDQVWQITEYQKEPFVLAHDAIVIDSGSFGSFLLSRVSGGTAVRVKRLR